ncbi:Mitogen-activated protein kinase kinase kinase 1 [Holothuria leucospilota]|uniref:non-specific serine/threonine protein kinase n=1 Tax=Holothuria leucospilota TaxID=206669 RepID=A0A9Q1C7P4_HOLLE|nr:Mitogen-activated protein kinase kinase kinase 1 [Holothuria leucospilota]
MTCNNPQNMPQKTSDHMEAPSVRSLGGEFIQEPLLTNPYEDVQTWEQPYVDGNGDFQKQEKTLLGDKGESQGCTTSSNRESVEASSCKEDSLMKRTEALTREVCQNRVKYAAQVSDVKSFSGAGYNDGVLMNQNLTTLNGQYRFNKEFLKDKVIGRGENGTVMACRDWKTGKKIATKTIQTEDLSSSEVDILAEVMYQPFIINFLGVTTEGSIWYLHMELFEGSHNLEYFAQEGYKRLLSQFIVVEICSQLLKALEFLAVRQIIHRNLTGKNILLIPDAYLMVKVIDFGLAERAPYQKKDGWPGGNLLYFAPEIVDGEEFLTTAVDVWSAAINIIFLLRGSAECKACDQQPGKWHPLKCSHISHCHPALRQLLELMLNPKWNKRPSPSKLLKEKVFKVSPEELQQYPVRPAASNIGRRKPPGSGKSADGGISVGMGLPSCDTGFVSSPMEYVDLLVILH